MRAMVMTRFGGPDVFESRDVPSPNAGPGELVVRILATAVNRVDARLRVDGRWAGLTPPCVIGYDAAGVVEEVGDGVLGFRPGQEVFYTPEIFGNHCGTYAEYGCVPATIVARMPRHLSFVEAAAVPLAGGTAWEAIVRRLAVRPGETVLVHGGAGGVGSFAIQMAKAAGCRVLATASEGHLPVLTELGADVALDYRGHDVVQACLDDTAGRGVDAVLEVEGADLVGRSLPAVRSFGRIATILPPGGDLAPLAQKNVTLHGVFLTRERARLEEMTPLLERGQVKPRIDQVMPLAEVAAAHERLDSRHGVGKVVLEVARR
jgi:NADPH2:quinone reductase